MPDEISVTSATPILVVDAIETCLPFYETIGFKPIMTVPEAPPYAFAILQCGAVELMLQTKASVAEDVPAIGRAVQASVLYISVASLAPVLARLADAPVAVARRTTFYGADEIFLHDPAGNVIGFAAQPAG